MLGLTSSLLSSVPGVSHRFFTRVGGTSPQPWRGLNTSYDVGDAPARVDENMARVRFQLGVRKRCLYLPKQVHGDVVMEVDAQSDGEEVANKNADGVFTRAAEIAVGVRTADCAPVLFASKNGSVVAAAHAGWRGAVGGILEQTLAAMGEAGVPSSDIVAAVGPCIGPDAFEVGPKVIAAAEERASVEGLVKPGANDRVFFDLAGYCERVLRAAKVAEVDVIRACTVTDEETFFSYRRTGGKTGRMMSAIARTNPPELEH